MGGGAWEGRELETRQISYKTPAAAWGRRMEERQGKGNFVSAGVGQPSSHRMGDILRKETQRVKESILQKQEGKTKLCFSEEPFLVS